MPIITTLVMMRSSESPEPKSPSAWLANQSWPMISATVRLRLKPCLPVEQNEQSSAQPACEETHSVPRFVLGDEHRLDRVATADIEQPLARAVGRQRVAHGLRCANFRDLGKIRAQRSCQIGHRDRSRSRRADESSCSTCRARNGFSPRSAKNRAQSVGVEIQQIDRHAASRYRRSARIDAQLAGKK